MDTHTHTYIHTYIHTYVHTYVHTYIHRYIHTYITWHVLVYMSCICKGFSAHWNLDCNLQVWYAKRVGLIRRFLYYHVAASLILESAKGSLQWISMTIYSDFARCCLQNFVCIPCHACNSGTTLEITIRSDQQTKLGVGHVFFMWKINIQWI